MDFRHFLFPHQTSVASFDGFQWQFGPRIVNLFYTVLYWYMHFTLSRESTLVIYLCKLATLSVMTYTCYLVAGTQDLSVMSW